MRMSRFRGLLDFGVGGVEAAVSEVVPDRSGKEHRLLQHDRDLLAERPHFVMPYILAVEDDAAGRRAVEPRNQADERRLAGAGQANERNHLARLRRECDVLQDARAVRIGERDVLEANVSSDVDGVNRIRIIHRFGHQREHRPHTLGSGNRALQLPCRVCDRGKRPVYRSEIADDDREVADRQRAAHDETPADDDNERRSQHDDRAHHQ